METKRSSMLNGLITSETLKRNSTLLGMEGMSKEDSEAMVREGDLDRDFN